MNSSSRQGSRHYSPSSRRKASPAGSTKLDLVFSALSNRTRREIVMRLSRGESTVTELAEPYNVSLPAISKHLHILEEAHVIRKVKEGRTYRCSLEPDQLVQVARWVNFYKGLWERQLDSLSEYVRDSGGVER